MARACRWEGQTLYRGEWQGFGCFKSKQAAQQAAMNRQAETGRDISVVNRKANGSTVVYFRDHQKRKWRRSR